MNLVVEETTYPFENDNGDVRQLSFEQMMDADACGDLVIDGVTWHRARSREKRFETQDSQRAPERTSILSDSLGFTKKQLAERIDHLKQSGCKGIEFKEDRDVPGFFQVECASEASKLKYAKTLGMVDRNSLNGSSAMLSPSLIEGAKELVLRKWG